jgi:hypothetical protein
MSTENVDRQQQRQKEFMFLLPLTVEIAGLPTTEPGRHLNEGQMEVRANSIKAAYKLARQLIIDISK